MYVRYINFYVYMNLYSRAPSVLSHEGVSRSQSAPVCMYGSTYSFINGYRKQMHGGVWITSLHQPIPPPEILGKLHMDLESLCDPRTQVRGDATLSDTGNRANRELDPLLSPLHPLAGG